MEKFVNDPIEFTYIERSGDLTYDSICVEVGTNPAVNIPIIGTLQAYKEHTIQLLQVLEKVLNESTD